jgi:hypothetical protein
VKLVAAITAGTLLGVCARLGDFLPGVFPWLANIGGPWLLLAFAIGRRSGGQPMGSAAAALLAAVAAKYAIQHLEGGFSALHAMRRAAEWSFPAIGVGAAYGWLGGRSSQRPRMAMTLLSLSLMIEAVGLLSRVIPAESADLRYSGQVAGTTVLTIELVIGLIGVIIAGACLPRARGRELPGDLTQAARSPR